MLRQCRKEPRGKAAALLGAPLNEVLGQGVDDASEPVRVRVHCGDDGAERLASVLEAVARLAALADGHEEQLPSQTFKFPQNLIGGVECGDFEKRRALPSIARHPGTATSSPTTAP